MSIENNTEIKQYAAPIADILLLGNEDILTESGGFPGDWDENI